CPGRRRVGSSLRRGRTPEARTRAQPVSHRGDPSRSRLEGSNPRAHRSARRCAARAAHRGRRKPSSSYRRALSKQLEEPDTGGTYVAGAEHEDEVARTRVVGEDTRRRLRVGNVGAARARRERLRAGSAVGRLTRRREGLGDDAIVGGPKRRGEVVEESTQAT